tara:strand:- start:388 stop:555 length:168 start_codon:yes stop_codon:yes gene_type:complete
VGRKLIRSSLQDKKLLQLLRKELDVTINSFGLKIKRLENDVRSLRAKVKKLQKGE